MSQTIKKRTQETPKGTPSTESKPRCLAVAQGGIKTANQFAQFMSDLITDVIEGGLTPQVSNAAVNAGGKLLKVVEMQYKYGKTQPNGEVRTLDLVSNDT